MTTTWDRTTIGNLLDSNVKAVERGIVRLFERQTSDEQQSEHTQHRNGRGFMSCHASRGSYYAKWVLSGRKLTGHHLDNARKICHRHIGQLVEVANESKAVVAQ